MREAPSCYKHGFAFTVLLVCRRRAPPTPSKAGSPCSGFSRGSLPRSRFMELDRPWSTAPASPFFPSTAYRTARKSQLSATRPLIILGWAGPIGVVPSVPARVCPRQGHVTPLFHFPTSSVRVLYRFAGCSYGFKTMVQTVCNVPGEPGTDCNGRQVIWEPTPTPTGVMV
jgi:hypothetical protein